MRRRTLALVVACAVTVIAAPSATAAPTHIPAQAAAGWLARQLVDGDHMVTEFGGITYPDQGLTIDTVFALAASGTSDGHGGAALTWLARPENLGGYIGTDGEAYAGATAKTALAVQVRGGNPTAFGGVDLIARLRSLQAPSGRFSDVSAWGDFSNTITQSLAVITLGRTTAGAPTKAVDFLAAAQCADGGYPITLGAPTCVSDTDATGFAVQALAAAHRPVHPAVTWLVGRQQSGGGLASGPGTGTPNANSTALALQAFQVGGRPLPGLRARAYLLGLRVTCAGPVADRGAIAFDASGFATATAARATPQAVVALRGRPLATLSSAGSTSAVPTLAC
ncbi:prenyltransferase/squalene oxidase repeat-containing protein [Actinokineospora diospyrosa]|uniref:Prenyltransferase and squalene oxidase repeat-containing protein n=1 Tax=Actinokineospora diospyrosa TaxID=103728 RepID=A0ABT1INL6_9PSEU|nr:prenyltransferase/squalene oxidase repeat-containing protein [Actinokineospora diospyrosa]MCP2274267.1 Prenyltransferase and squalene oxidase repeat-containing protein [Actinokineospora diospyrosa]